jgi:hypothetical protein
MWLRVSLNKQLLLLRQLSLLPNPQHRPDMLHLSPQTIVWLLAEAFAASAAFISAAICAPGATSASFQLWPSFPTSFICVQLNHSPHQHIFLMRQLSLLLNHQHRPDMPTLSPQTFLQPLSEAFAASAAFVSAAIIAPAATSTSFQLALAVLPFVLVTLSAMQQASTIYSSRNHCQRLASRRGAPISRFKKVLEGTQAKGANHESLVLSIPVFVLRLSGKATEIPPCSEISSRNLADIIPRVMFASLSSLSYSPISFCLLNQKLSPLSPPIEHSNSCFFFLPRPNFGLEFSFTLQSG